MTMHKMRQPGSIADAISRIIGDMTAEDAGAAIGKSDSLIRKWSDPDTDNWPDSMQILALDVAYTNAGHGNGPITYYMRELWREAVADDGHIAMCPTVRHLHVNRELGDVSKAVLDLRDKPALTPNEFDRADREIHEVIDELQKLRRDLKSKVPKIAQRKPVIVAERMAAE